MSRFTVLMLLLLGFLSACAKDDSLSADEQLQARQQLGKLLFNDVNLSEPAGQACASCHAATSGFADPDADIPVSRGVHPDRFGSRNSPMSGYAAFSPVFFYDDVEGLFFGGQFLDGRAHTLEEQAKQPFLNAVEMANTDEISVVAKVRRADYAPLFIAIYGDVFNDTMVAYDAIADAIAAFERSDEMNPFSSKFDLFLAGQVVLSEQEIRGFALFNNPDKGNCAACHPSTAVDNKPLFTDFSYDNIGVPGNPDSPFLKQSAEFNPAGEGFVDLGLGGVLAMRSENGKFKVPSLRNVAVSAPYMHNGSFATLAEVVHFYNTRDVEVWPAAEVSENINNDELGNLGLTVQEEADLVVFLETLTDGYQQ